jgi:phytoene synthase
MAAAYRPILERVVGRGFAPPRTRVRTPKHRVLLAALRYGLV